MKRIIIFMVSLFGSMSFAANPNCENATFSVEQKTKNYSWKLDSKTPFVKWIVVKNNDTGTLYPNQQIKKSSGIIYGADLAPNKNGYEVMAMDTSAEESKVLNEHLKTCVQKRDCSIPLKLNRCVIGKVAIKAK